MEERIQKSLSSDGHYTVVLAVDKSKNEVLFQTLGSKLNKIFHFPNENVIPNIDVDTVSFLNYRKYSDILCKDTCLIMLYGADREILPVFMSQKYKKKGSLSDHNKRALIVSLIPSRCYQLRPADALLINKYFRNQKI